MDKRVALRYLTAECPTRPFGAPRSATSGALDRIRPNALAVVRFPAGGTKGTSGALVAHKLCAFSSIG